MSQYAALARTDYMEPENWLVSLLFDLTLMAGGVAIICILVYAYMGTL